MKLKKTDYMIVRVFMSLLGVSVNSSLAVIHSVNIGQARPGQARQL